MYKKGSTGEQHRTIGCLPRAGGDPSLIMDGGNAGHGSPPARGRQYVLKPNAFPCLALIFSCLLLPGCVSNIWTGATMVYGRHSTYMKINSFQLNASANRALYKDKVFKQDGIGIELAVLNRDILMVGHVPTVALREEAYARVDAATPGKRRLFNQLSIASGAGDSVRDTWITAKIRSRIIADSDINPDAFKIVTSERIVYLMGDVIPAQAEKVILFARKCAGVKRVVKLFRYYNLSDHPI